MTIQSLKLPDFNYRTFLSVFKRRSNAFYIEMKVDQGAIYGFLGPNGSGKTTTLSLLPGLLKNQQGEIEIFGKNIGHHRIDVLRRIGSLIEIPSLYGHLTAKENLDVYRQVYGVKKERVREVLPIVQWYLIFTAVMFLILGFIDFRTRKIKA